MLVREKQGKPCFFVHQDRDPYEGASIEVNNLWLKAKAQKLSFLFKINLSIDKEQKIRHSKILIKMANYNRFM